MLYLPVHARQKDTAPPAIINGFSAPLPGWGAGYLGFIYLPALVGVAATSILTAPLGAKLAHSLPVGKLKKIFAVLLLAMGTKMLWPLITPYFG